jgi:hypothetical protein
MNTVQTNVRVVPVDKPLVRALAARLRIEPRFRERLQALLEEEPAPALHERIEKLEQEVRWLLAAADHDPPRLRAAVNGG